MKNYTYKAMETVDENIAVLHALREIAGSEVFQQVSALLEKHFSDRLRPSGKHWYAQEYLWGEPNWDKIDKLTAEFAEIGHSLTRVDTREGGACRDYIIEWGWPADLKIYVTISVYLDEGVCERVVIGHETVPIYEVRCRPPSGGSTVPPPILKEI